MSNVSFGQYYPTQSFVHKCDPRQKIVFLIVFIVAVSLSTTFYALGACAFVLAIAVAFSRIPLKSLLKSVKAVIFLLLFTAILNLFFHKGETPLWEGSFITQEAVYFTLFLSVRLCLLVLVSSLLTLTTSPVSLTDGVESLLTPLKWIRFPVHELALIMSLALRFIPTLGEQTSRIMNAQKARGANFETGSLVKRAKAVIPILIPLLISAFRSSEELGDAMNARCYSGSKKRTKYKKLTFGWRDLLSFLLVVALLVGVIVMRVYLPAL